MTMDPKVSVIIPTYNSAEFLEPCLRSIKHQTYKNIEIIVVDNYSTDETEEISLRHNVTFIKEKSIRSKARNTAFKLSDGQFIFSMDSDMELTSTVIEEAVAKSEQYDALIIPEKSIGKGFWTKCKALEKKCYIGDDTIEASRFFSSDVFRNINGYDISLEFAEDWDFHLRIKNAGFKTGSIESMILHNEGDLTLWKTIKNKYNYGKTLENYRAKHPKNFSGQSRRMLLAIIGKQTLLTENITVSAGMLFMKGCEFSAATVGYLTTKVR